MAFGRKVGLSAAGFVLAGVTLFAPAADRHVRAAGMLLRLTDPADHSAIADYRRHAVAVTRLEFPTPRGLVPAKLYTPVGVERPGTMVVLHGVHYLGIDEPRLIAFSTAIAESGVQVLTPLLAELADYRISPATVEIIGSAAGYLHQRTGRRPGVLGLSFAGGLALIAATDDRYRRDIDFVVAVGAHHDLERVAAFFATGEARRPDGTTLHMAPNNYGPMVLVFSSPEDFFTGRDVEIARHALKTLLQTESIETARPLTTAMSAAGKQVMEKVFAADRGALRSQLLSSIARHRNQMAQASPNGRLGRLQVPVLLIHGSGDDVIPPSETGWLAIEAPVAVVKEVLVTPLLSHVNLETQPTLQDRARLIRFMAEMLEAAALDSMETPRNQRVSK
jgi:pimeloyl-ACP methyl ester carboxylesterase